MARDYIDLSEHERFISAMGLDVEMMEHLGNPTNLQAIIIGIAMRVRLLESKLGLEDGENAP